MSAFWDVECIDCNESLGLHGNHQERGANAIAADAARLALVPGIRVNAYHYYDFSNEGNGLDATFPTDFFAKHKGHDIRARNEYGALSNVCKTWVACAHCGRTGDCNLEPGHHGGHDPTLFPGRVKVGPDVLGEVARLIHKKVGHIDDVEGEAGGCYRLAEEIFHLLTIKAV